MPKYDIGGHVYETEQPLTQEQLTAYAKVLAKPAGEGSKLPSWMPNRIGGMADFIKGAKQLASIPAGLAGVLPDVASTISGAIDSTFGLRPAPPMPGTTKGLEQTMGMPQPQSPAEEALVKTGENLGAFLLPMGGLKAGKIVPEIAESVRLALGAAPGGAVVGQVAREAARDTPYEGLAEFGGSLAGAVAGGKFATRGQPPARVPGIPEQEPNIAVKGPVEGGGPVMQRMSPPFGETPPGPGGPRVAPALPPESLWQQYEPPPYIPSSEVPGLPLTDAAARTIRPSAVGEPYPVTEVGKQAAGALETRVTGEAPPRLTVAEETREAQKAALRADRAAAAAADVPAVAKPPETIRDVTTGATHEVPPAPWEAETTRAQGHEQTMDAAARAVRGGGENLATVAQAAQPESRGFRWTQKWGNPDDPKAPEHFEVYRPGNPRQDTQYLAVSRLRDGRWRVDAPYLTTNKFTGVAEPGHRPLGTFISEEEAGRAAERLHDSLYPHTKPPASEAPPRPRESPAPAAPDTSADVYPFGESGRPPKPGEPPTGEPPAAGPGPSAPAAAARAAAGASATRTDARGARTVSTSVPPDQRSPIPPAGVIPPERVQNFKLEKVPNAADRDTLRDTMVELADEQMTQRRGVQGWERTNALAERIRVPLETVLKPGTTLNAEETRAYQNAISWVQAKIRLSAADIDPANATSAQVLEHAMLIRQHAKLVKSLAGATAESGRALNIYRQMWNIVKSGDQEAIEKTVRWGRERGRLAQLKAQLAASDDPLEQYRLLQAMNEPSAMDYFRSWMYGNLLSGIKTQERNILGNVSRLVLNEATIPMRAVLSKVARQDLAYFGEIGPANRGLLKGWQQGMKDASFILKNGYHPRLIGSSMGEVADKYMDRPRVELGGLFRSLEAGAETAGGRAAARLGRYAATPWDMTGRALEAADAIFRQAAEESALHAGAYHRAYAEAKASGLTKRLSKKDLNTHLRERVADMVVEPPADLLAEARHFGARGVYAEQGGKFSKMLLGVKRQLGIFGDMLMPFIRIPANIARQSMQFSPLGVATHESRGLIPGLEGVAAQRAAMQAHAETALGTLALAPFAWAASNSLLTGSAPLDPVKRAEFYEKGKIPDAFWLPHGFSALAQSLGGTKAKGGYWVSNTVFGPLALPMSTVANAFEEAHNAKNPTSAITNWALASARSFFHQSYLQGFEDFADFLQFIQAPDRYAAEAKRAVAMRLAGIVVPLTGLQRNLTQAMDPVLRRPKGVVEGLKAGIPGLSEELQPKINRKGEPIMRQGALPGTPAEPVLRGFFVPEISKEQNDPIADELQRLDVKLTAPSGKFKVRGPSGVTEQIELTPQQETELMQLRGKTAWGAVERHIRSPTYKAMGEMAKKRLLEAVIKSARSEAHDRYMPTALRLMKQQLKEKAAKAESHVEGKPIQPNL